MNMLARWRKPEPISTPLPILTEHEACQLVGFHDAMVAQSRDEAVSLRDRLKEEIQAKQDALATVEEWLSRMDMALAIPAVAVASQPVSPSSRKRKKGEA